MQKDNGEKTTVDEAIRDILKDNGIDTDPLEFLTQITSVWELIVFATLEKTGVVESGATAEADYFVNKLWSLILAAMIQPTPGTDEGLTPEDERIRSQAKILLSAIERLLEQGKYEVPETLILQLSGCESNERRARAYELRQIMGKLSWVLIPQNDGETLAPQCKVKINSILEVKATCQVDITKVYELACKHWRTGSTLQALAIKIFIERLKSEGLNLPNDFDEYLKGDLRELKKWEKENPTRCSGGWVVMIGGPNLPFKEFSSSWQKKYLRRMEGGTI